VLHPCGEFGLLAAGGRSYCLTCERGSSQLLVFSRAICCENTWSSHVSGLQEEISRRIKKPPRGRYQHMIRGPEANVLGCAESGSPTVSEAAPQEPVRPQPFQIPRRASEDAVLRAQVQVPRRVGAAGHHCPMIILQCVNGRDLLRPSEFVRLPHRPLPACSHDIAGKRVACASSLTQSQDQSFRAGYRPLECGGAEIGAFKDDAQLAGRHGDFALKGGLKEPCRCHDAIHDAILLHIIV